MQTDLQTEPVEVCPRWSAIQSQVAREWLSCTSHCPSSFCLVCTLAGSNHQSPQALWTDSEDRASEQLHL